MSSSKTLGGLQAKSEAPLRIQTLGGFHVWHNGLKLGPAAWGREKALHLFQLFVTMRQSGTHLHKEQIIDRLWPEADLEGGDRDFKVALHTINKTLEPERKPRAEPHFIHRYGLTYGLNLEGVWIDADEFERLIAVGNQAKPSDEQTAIACYQQALALYKGDYLPERRYEDWSSAERERLQVLALGVMTTLANLMLSQSPLESIRLTQRVLRIDPIWEDAYRIQMQAYASQGNRPLAIRTYQQCVAALADELGLDPLPETLQLYQQIKGK